MTPSPAVPGAAAAPALPTTPPPVTPRGFSCRCGRPIFFSNSECLACHTPLGYEPEAGRLLPLQPDAPLADAGGGAPAGGDGGVAASPAPAPLPVWREADTAEGAPRYHRCSNLQTAAACNWLVALDDAHAGAPPLCRCCRLTRTLPDLSLDNGPLWWMRIEMAKRRLVSSLIGLKLPVASKTSEDPAHGLVFDLLRAEPGGKSVITGHADGVITLDVAEADDAFREQRRASLHEPYRTLLGHLRHECGHYYWQRLVEPGPWLEPFRAVFGDERQDYMAALQRHYDAGPPADWGDRHVSAYASSHPWEDWAETWAHYLHLVDTLDTARSFGLDGERVELSYERYGTEVLGDAAAADPDGAAQFLHILHGWMELTGVLNELSRSMGVPDFYPFVLSAPAVRKLHLVHRVIATAPPSAHPPRDRPVPQPATAPSPVAAPLPAAVPAAEPAP